MNGEVLGSLKMSEGLLLKEGSLNLQQACVKIQVSYPVKLFLQLLCPNDGYRIKEVV